MTPHRAYLFHLPALLNILWRHTRDAGEDSRDRLTDLWLMAKVILRGWVRYLRDEDGAAGFIIRDGQRVHALYVHPRAQGHGVGRILLNDAKAQADRLELWTLQQNHLARAFYLAQGFLEAAHTAGDGNDEGLPDVLLIWQKDDFS
ncbi:GNAT family N-acetyltransferase [Thalassovita sp.]|uniref:GNAT family N-acetyltransferase n=1 Tax=Thalassovita sp. TaxID=1979401 RepID=UPI0029DE6BC4|nr:GNAT family N-acetyltransferase [Thalassovita sp.]